MKIKRILVAALLLAAFVTSSFAQDSRGRTVRTAIQDVLAIVPVQTVDELNSEISDLANAAPESVTLLASMLHGAGSGKNEKVEYVLSALANFASDPANAAVVPGVRDGFAKAADACAEGYNRDFLLSLLRLVDYENQPSPEALAPAADKAVCRKWGKCAFRRLSADAKDDAVYRIGEARDASQIKLVLSALNGEAPLAQTAAVAASKIGGPEAAKALISNISRTDIDVMESIRAFNGDIRPELLAALRNAGDDKTALVRLVQLCGERRIKEAGSIVGTLVSSSTPEVSKAAYGAIVGVSERGDAAVIDILVSGARSGSADALDALASVDDFAVAPYMLEFAPVNPWLLCRYNQLVMAYAPEEEKLACLKTSLSKASALGGDPVLKSALLWDMASMPSPETFDVAAAYLGDAAISHTAAEVVKSIATSSAAEIPYTGLKRALDKAVAIFNAGGSADDGYAVIEIEKLLADSAPYVNRLSAEEEAEGFVLLFNGEDLSGWEGDLVDYTPVNGTINVDTQFGGNLYTEKEYRDFIFRFEFCFLRPAINNGVGIRTPKGVDAAYDGMCEVQILDHDDPCYSWLNEYQVHGSVYGVIPARRIVHKPLGEWSTEEIVVKGDRIKVTVNGEVILDGNVRDACQGHNVSPDGSNENPFTADHHNHPGMFNEKGHISFCGHGSGLKFRNIRIKEL